MVTNITSLTGFGLKDWLIQRVTAIYFAAYALSLFVFFLCHPNLQFEQWQLLFKCSVFKVATQLALFSFLFHSWVGLWTVTTDYLKCTVLRLSVQLLVLLVLLSQFIWGLMIVWGQ
ncbi:MAG: succinate dehydrogenase, hydrophobic membrane anchor protein [Legionella sp.]